MLDSKKAIDLPYVQACMWHWANFHFRSMDGGYGHISLTGQFMQGMPSTTCKCRGGNPDCILCDGSGRISGELRSEMKPLTIECDMCDRDKWGYPSGEINGRTCFKCRGGKARLLIAQKINPAGIKSTKMVGSIGFTDHVFEAIESTVREWGKANETRMYRKVVLREYFYNGTQEMKADALRISRTFYIRKLREAYQVIEPILKRAG